MSVATIEAPTQVAPAQTVFRTRRWTVAEFERLISLGILREGSPEFLWNGEIVEPMREDESHANALDILFQCLYDRLGKVEWTVRSNHPLGLREGYLPNPDIVVLSGARSSYRGRRPTTADACLVVEIANTSYPDDARIMLPEYARGGVAQYWIVHLNARRVEVYRGPHLVGDVGTYAPPALYPLGTEIPLRLAPGPGQPEREFPPIPVAEILPELKEEEQ